MGVALYIRGPYKFMMVISSVNDVDMICCSSLYSILSNVRPVCSVKMRGCSVRHRSTDTNDHCYKEIERDLKSFYVPRVVQSLWSMGDYFR